MQCSALAPDIHVDVALTHTTYLNIISEQEHSKCRFPNEKQMPEFLSKRSKEDPTANVALPGTTGHPQRSFAHVLTAQSCWGNNRGSKTSSRWF